MVTKVKDVPLKGGGFEWKAVAKDHWHGKVPDGKLPPRIRQLDAKTFSCYRDGKYLGSESSMVAAFDRIKSNHLSDKNVAFAIWRQHHPNELPPGLNLTEAERAAYWHDNPPKGGTIKAVAPSRGVAKAEVFAAPYGDGEAAKSLPPTHPAVRGASKDTREANAAAPKAKRGEGGNKDAEIKALLLRGCTSEEVLRVTGWKAISMPAMAKKLGLELRIEKGAKPFKYYGTEK